MNILWLSHLVPYPPRSGVAQRSLGLLTELCKRHTVTLLAFHQPALMKSMSQNPVTALTDAVRHLSTICARVEVFPIPAEQTRTARYALAFSSLLRKQPYTINWLESREFAKALRNGRAGDFDLVHFDTISLAAYRDCIERVPCVMNHHNIESHLLHRRARGDGPFVARAYDWQEAIRLERYERQTADRFQSHVTCSELDKERLLRIAPAARCCVIPNGVDLEYFEPRLSSAPEPTFSFVGTLGWGPNRDAADTIATRLWPALAREWPQAKMYLVGANPPPSARAVAARDPRFVVTGFTDDVRPHLAATSFFVCPITEGGGTKLKILNAMALGKVVIAHPIACEGIDVVPGNNALLASSVDDYIRETRALLADTPRYLRIARAARELIETRYAYAVIGREMDREYRAVHATFGSQR